VGFTGVGQHWWRRLLLLASEAAIRGGWEDPVVALHADLDTFEQTGEQALAGTSRDLLRRAGAPTRRAAAIPVPTHAPGGVTAREIDLLTLIAEGLTNSRSRNGCSSRHGPSRPTSPTCSPRPAPPAAASCRP
jgi:hypothetical protein